MGNSLPHVELTDGTPNAHDSVDCAWRLSLRAIQEQGNWVAPVRDKHSIGSHFGASSRPFRELTGFSFKIDNPRKRVVLSEARKLNFPFLFANLIWTLSGSDLLDMIAHYNARGVCFSDDGVTLASAFGPKLFGPTPSQFDGIARLLLDDPSTRRAVIDLFDQTTLLRGSKDVSCALSMQFLIRNGQLDCIVYMRSQSALMVLPYDLFLFTMLHECMAARVGVPLGQYSHFCSSIHYYLDEEPQVVQTMLETAPTTIEPMPIMTEFNEDVRARIISVESKLRAVIFSSTNFEQRDLMSLVSTSGLSKYWQSLFSAFFGEGLHRMDVSSNRLRVAK